MKNFNISKSIFSDNLCRIAYRKEDFSSISLNGSQIKLSFDRRNKQKKPIVYFENKSMGKFTIDFTQAPDFLGKYRLDLFIGKNK